MALCPNKLWEKFSLAHNMILNKFLKYAYLWKKKKNLML